MIIRYLLDTNILIALIRDNATRQYLRQVYTLLMQELIPIYSVVTAAELRSFASQESWGSRKIEQMEFYLKAFECVWIDTPKLVNAYTAIDAHSIKIGRSMGKNDVWIAATANALNAHLLTTDKDFDHLNPLFLTHTYIDPDAAQKGSE